MEISVIGPGYVGLVTAVVFSEMGNNVRCVGRRQEQVDALSSGKVTIYEPGLEEIMVRNLKNGRLKFTVDVRQAVSDSEIVFICVGTPPGQDGSSDLSAVYNAAETVGDLITKYTIVVNKSTVPVGTADQVREIIESRLKKRNVQCDFDVVSNPEFLKEGDALNDFMKPDRIVVGTSSEKAAMKMRELYSGFSLMKDKLIFMDVRSSEMTKYASNCMLAAKISFINEIANICERVGADVACVRQGVGSDRRIGYQFIYPGAGYGGSCFPKDVKALISTARKSSYTPELLEAIENVNARQKKIIAQKILDFFELDVQGRTLAVWGLAFKPNTDDVREAPAFELIRLLTDKGMKIRAYDPIAGSKSREKLAQNPLVSIFDDQYQVLEQADALAIMTEWNEFRNPDFSIMAEKLASTVVFDGRNIFDPGYMSEKGFRYYGIGRPGHEGSSACTWDSGFTK